MFGLKTNKKVDELLGLTERISLLVGSLQSRLSRLSSQVWTVKSHVECDECGVLVNKSKAYPTPRESRDFNVITGEVEKTLENEYLCKRCALEREKEETKVCGNCKERLPLDSFHIRKAADDGRQAWCKDCMNEYNKNRNQ